MLTSLAEGIGVDKSDLRQISTILEGENQRRVVCHDHAALPAISFHVSYPISSEPLGNLCMDSSSHALSDLTFPAIGSFEAVRMCFCNSC